MATVKVVFPCLDDYDDNTLPNPVINSIQLVSFDAGSFDTLASQSISIYCVFKLACISAYKCPLLSMMLLCCFFLCMHSHTPHV